MSRKNFVHSYSKIPCKECGKLISGNGLAQSNHHKMHQRLKKKIFNDSKTEKQEVCDCKHTKCKFRNGELCITKHCADYIKQT